ncbi:MAG: DUF1932 domain-containing protein [Elusimicrobiota bacterium]
MADQVGVMHPGDMGISIAAAAKRGGSDVSWASAGRSDATRKRADEHGLRDAGSVRKLCESCAVLLSVCPPDAAEAVANEVLGFGFKGLYVDGNAISPQRAKRIGETMARAGADFVDGGIIGGPAWKPGTTWLCLSGPSAAKAAALFAGSLLETEVLDESIGRASALKMCYAAYTKGTTALLGSILGAASDLGVRDALYGHWARNGPNFVAQAETRVSEAALKAWRWVGEMEEISATLSEAGVPGGFHMAAAQLFRTLAGFKGEQAAPSIAQVLEALGKAAASR